MSTLQLTSACLEQWAALRDRIARSSPTMAPVLDFLVAKLAAADKYQLPNGGRVYPAAEVGWPEDLTRHLRPEGDRPVVLEYLAAAEPGRVTPHGQTPYDSTMSSQRIALAWHYDGKLPGTRAGPMRVGPVPDSGVCVVSISYVDQYGMWAPPYAGHFIEYGSALERPRVLAADQAARLADRAPGRDPGLAVYARMFALDMQSVLNSAMELGGAKQAAEAVAADVFDEQNAYLAFCLHKARGELAYRPVAVAYAEALQRITDGRHEAFDVTLVMRKGKQ